MENDLNQNGLLIQKQDILDRFSPNPNQTSLNKKQTSNSNVPYTSVPVKTNSMWSSFL